MKCKYAFFLLTPFIVLTLFASSPATVEWEVVKTLSLEKAPLDVAVSNNGRYVYVLTEEGVIYIYASDGTKKEKIVVGKSIDGIKAGPIEDVLFLTSRSDKTVQVVTIDFIQNINVSGSPFKGAVDAPVVVAVFSDFQ
jgi:hypothetical protein